MQKKAYIRIVLLLSMVSMSTYSFVHAEPGLSETEAKPKRALPSLLQKLLGQNQPIFQEEVETTQLRQYLDTINNIGKIEDKIILYSIYDTFYFSVLQQNQQPINADVRENLYAFKNELKKQIVNDKIAHFTKVHAKPPLEAEKQAMEHSAEQYYDHVIAIPLEEKLERIQGIEKVYVASAHDDKERQARRFMFDWTQLRVNDIIQARDIQRTSLWRRHKRKIIAVCTLIAAAGIGFAGYKRYYDKSITLGGDAAPHNNPYDCTRKYAQDHAILHARAYFVYNKKVIKSGFESAKRDKKEGEFWVDLTDKAWGHIERSLEALHETYNGETGAPLDKKSVSKTATQTLGEISVTSNGGTTSTSNSNAPSSKPTKEAENPKGGLKNFLSQTLISKRVIFARAIEKGLGKECYNSARLHYLDGNDKVTIAKSTFFRQ